MIKKIAITIPDLQISLSYKDGKRYNIRRLKKAVNKHCKELKKTYVKFLKSRYK